jgi:ubiquinone/menaquinone biosynthesis C-methylase UbiE
MSSWEKYFDQADTDLFSNAIRLRYFIWSIRDRFPKNFKLLEIGCGTGTTAVLLADLGYRVTGVDLVPEIINNIGSRYTDWIRTGKVSVQVADMFALPWQSQTFDVVYHQGVLEHFPDEKIEQALREQRRVAKHLVFDVPNHRYGSQPFGDERLLRPSHWRTLLTRSGWRVTDQLGREFSSLLYALPYGLFSRSALGKMPGFSRMFGAASIFIAE